MNPYESPPQAITPEQLRSVPPEVEIEYEVTFDDLASFSWETLQRQRYWFDLVILVTVPLLTLSELWPLRHAILRDPAMLLQFDPLSKIIAALLTGLIVAGLLRLSYRLGLMRRLCAVIDYAAALVLGKACMVGPFRCRANHREITEFTLARPYTFPIARVRRIKVTAEHVGMNLTLSYAIVIPRRAFATAEAVDAFVAALEAYTGKSAEYLQPRKSEVAAHSPQTE